MDHLLKSSAILCIFYACYKVFLQRDTFFEANRWFFLFGLIMASCISLIIIPNYIEYTPLDYSKLDIITSNADTLVQEKTYNYLKLLTWIYSAGLLFFSGKLIVELLSLNRILRTGQIKVAKSIKYVETTERVAPFSFFNYIVYNPVQFNEEELIHVINHEKAHVQHLHSVDTIVAQIICVILWFNPFAWLYKKALQQNLEFIADNKAQYVSPCKKSYQTVLLKASVKNHQLVFTNNFYTSLIKKRIVMLHKSKSKKQNQLKLILVLPLLTFFIMSFNTKTIYVEALKENSKTTNQPSDSGESIEIIFTKNTSDKDLDEIKQELKSKGITFQYKDIKRNSDGEIIGISTEFRSEENTTSYNIYGDKSIKAFQFKSSEDTFSVGTLNYKLINENSETESSDKSNRVVILEETEDGNNNSTVHIKKFKSKDSIYLIRKNNKFTFSTGDTEDSSVIFQKSDEPIFIIDGTKVEKSIFEDVDSEDITSVFVLKGEKAIEKYGNEGKNGAIVMTKRNSKSTFSESDNNVIVKSETEFMVKTDGEDPLYIIDGQIVGKGDLSDINPDQIDSVEVLKDQTAITLYGKEGENGVIIIKTKKNGVLNNKNKGILLEKEDGSSYKIEVSNVYVTSDDKEITIELIITKSSSDSFLEQQKAALKKHGIDAKFSKVKRNKAGEITSIKISLDDNDGRKSSASWKEKNQGIPDIVMGKSNDDKLFIRAIGH